VSKETEKVTEESPPTTALALKADLKSLVVQDKPSFEASEALKATAKEAKKIAIVPATAHAEGLHDKWKKAVATRKKIEAEYDDVIAGVTQKQKTYRDEQRRLAEEAARKAQLEAKKKAEEERKKQAEHLADMGHKGAAEAVAATPIAEPVMAPVEVPKIKGERKVYGYTITNMAAFVDGCLKSKGPLTLSMLEESKELGAMVRALKVNFKAPGITVTVKES
jgi:colicin import membrane protein